MKKIYFLFVIALVAMMGSCKKEAEQTEAQPQTSEEKEVLTQPQPAGLQKIRLGRDLALFGYENESPEALIEAASILADVKTGDLQAPAEEGEATGEEAEKATEERSFVPADLLAKAKEYAGEDATILAMIKRVEDKIATAAEGERGSNLDEDGKVYTTKVNANSWTTYKVEFRADELAACAIIGDGDTDLDLYVYDENGNLIASDVDNTDQCYCSWNPRWTGEFTLKVVNRGNVFNRYTIAVN